MFNVLRLVDRNGLKKHDPLYNTQVPADKNREYLLAMKMFKETDTVTEAAELVFGYVIDEYQEMILAKQEIRKAIKNIENIAKINKTPFNREEVLKKAAQQLVLGYTLNNSGELATIFEDGSEVYEGGAFQFRLLESMNKEKLGLFDKTGLPNASNMQEGDALINDPETKAAIMRIIEDSLKDRIENTKNTFIEYGNDIFVGKNGKSLIPINDSMDRGIISYYLDKYKDRQSDNNAKLAYNAIFRDYVVNSMVSKIEYAKIFTGNLQYYKDNQDYIKRVPETYIDGLQPITGLTEGDVHFRQMTFATERIESTLMASELPDHVKKYYRSVDRTDAQGWITPERWKFLLERTGQFGTNQRIVYNKMQAQWDALEKGEEIIPLTAKEVNTLSAQPLKGVYFKNDYKNGPLYLKYSQAVLLPQFVASFPKAKALLEYMRLHKIDEAVADSGVKVGALKPVELEYKFDQNNKLFLDIKGKHSIRILDNRNWRLQQQLPTKGIHANKIGTQIQKQVVNDLRFIGKNMVTETMNGNQLADAIDNSFASLSDIQIEQFSKKFGIDEQFRINDIETFYKNIIEEMEENGEEIQNYIDVLKAQYPSAMLPTIEQKITSTFLAANKRAATNLLTPGGALIQISDHLVNVSEENKQGVKMLIPYNGLKPPRVLKDPISGRKIVIPGQVFIPHSMIVKLVPDYKEMSLEELNKVIPVDVKRMIGYRIPTQTRASTEILEVVGILPESMGDSIITYAEITAKTGSDFDIDKLFFMLPELELNNGVIQRVPEFKEIKSYNQKEVFSTITKEVEELVDIEGIEGIDKPIIKSNYLSDADIIGLEDSLGAKIKQDQLKKEIEDLEALINCIWS